VTSVAPSTGADAVVVAAGASTRMGGLDKLAVRLGGRPLLAWTLDALASAPIVERIVVVVAAEQVAAVLAWPDLPPSVAAVVPGGRRRQESVAAGIAELDRLDSDVDRSDQDRVVLVHDGARPVITAGLVARVAAAAAEHGAAIPVLPIAETVKRVVDDRVVSTVQRIDLAAAQTPQGFRRSVLRAGYERLDPAGEVEWTDEAALCESCSIAVHVVAGESSNLKVTQPTDLDRAAFLLGRPTGPRIGIGRDSHPFGPGTPLALGGIEILGAPRLHGHSDGDVALHAIADALLGATGLGDLGRLHPAGPTTPAGISSRVLIADVVGRLEQAGWRVSSLDVTIVGARPMLARHLDAMRASIAGLLALPPDAVSVKATSANLAGDAGAGRVLAAEAVATVTMATGR
jgi:2-C-methyl-D-erythritol 4-phosphate cytidylyltransferase/2-C-methyl-D-erythritol 2,4-cyclodiphosphate synthase